MIDINENVGKELLENIFEEFGENKAIFVKADVSNEQELEDAFKKTIEAFNQLDLVFNNAGVCEEQNFQKMIKINLGAVLVGTFLAMTKYLEYKEGKEGIIVNTASIAGLEPIAYIPGYSASKSGVVSLGRSFGHEAFYEKYKVKVLTICPGPVSTPMSTPSAADFLQQVLLPEFASEAIKVYTQYET